ncbi:MAG: FAD-dependent oxidoreductase [Promethearchaeota archaeon]
MVENSASKENNKLVNNSHKDVKPKKKDQKNSKKELPHSASSTSNEVNIFNDEWNFLNRNKYVEKLKKEKFDLIIIGGGMTGAGIAREAALRNIKTAIIDKNDFAFGTSSRSSKLAHGGFRYLAQGEFKLVRESTTERNWLRVHFPNIVRPVKFNMMAYKDIKSIKPWMIKFGIFMYDFLSNFGSKFKNYGKHRIVKPEEFFKEEPAIRKEGFILAGQYYDTNIDDARITLETIKESVARGSVTAVNYIEWEEYIYDEDGKIHGIKVKDNITGEEFEIHASQVVNATGIWTDTLLKNFNRKIIRPTKGVHIIIPKSRLKNNNAFGLRSLDDGRVFFVLPREQFTVIGTTDTDYQENFDTPWCYKEDCDYLFKTVNIMFPEANLTYDDIISTYAGIRPLVRDENAKSESDVSRKHVIFDTDDGLTTIAGGKLTIFRLMGEQLIYHLIKEKNTFNRKFSKKELKKGYSKQPFIIGLKKEEWSAWLQSKKDKGVKINLSEEQLEHLYRQYGKGAFKIVEEVEKNPELGKPFIEENMFCPAEINYILKYEFAPHLVDVLLRRTEIQLKVHHKKQPIIAEKVANIMAEYYNWDEDTKNKEIEAYLDYIKHTIWF